MRKFYTVIWSRWVRDFVPLVACMALIFALSHQSVLVEIEHAVGEKVFYKTAHIVVYAILTWLWWRALSPQREVSWPVLTTALSLTVLYGISDEIHQLFIPGRHGRIADVLFDASGALAMILLLRQYKWLRRIPEAIVS